MGGGQTLWLCLLPDNRAVRLQLLYFCIWSLSRGVCPIAGSAVLYADPSCRIAEATEGAPIVSILPSPGTTVSSRLHPPVSISALLPSLLPCSPQFTHLQMFQCTGLSDVFVCCIGNLLLNYSCSTCCDFKGRHQGACMPPCF